MDFHYRHHRQQTAQAMYQCYPAQYQQQEYYPQEYVEENTYLGGIPQMQAMGHYVNSSNGYYNLGTVVQQPQPRAMNTYNAPAEVYQPSPVVHAPIPILGAQFQDYGAYEPREATVTDANFYPEPAYAEPTYREPTYRVIAYAEPEGYAETHYTAQQEHTQTVQQAQPVAPAQPQSWDEVVSQPFLGPTFPTPSELLVELGSAYQDLPVAGSQYGSEGGGQGLGRMTTVVYSRQPSPATIDRAVNSASPESAISDGTRAPTPPRCSESETRPAGNRVASSRSTSLLPDAAPSSGSNPETISSHEKKRHYLECLEQYVLYLHNQFTLLGAHPVRFKRVDKYEGLKSRSVRTLLVHMEHNNKKLNTQTVAEEARFIALRDELYQKIGRPEVEEKM